MSRNDTLESQLSYELIRSSRKTLAIQIMRNGAVVVRAPKQMSKVVIDALIVEKHGWIQKKRGEIKRHQNIEAEQERATGQDDDFLKTMTESEIRIYREQAKDIFTRKANYYAAQMEVTYHRLTVRDQKTRWGSCSAKGNLNFNWRLVLAPVSVLDYVVIHELAHRREMNHSPHFWAIVETMMPDYRQQRLWLRKNGENLMR